MALDQAKLEALTTKVGGRFRLTALLQKRLVSLIRMRREGTRVPSTAELMDVAIGDIEAGKIILLEKGDEAPAMLTAGERELKEDKKDRKKEDD